MEQQTDKDKVDINGDTSLHEVARNRNVAAFIALVVDGANYSIKNSDGKTCFDLLSAKDKLIVLTGLELTLSLLQAHDWTLWFIIVQEEGFGDANLFANLLAKVNMLVSSDPTLTAAKDTNNRAAVDVASKPMKLIMQSVLLWHGRYRITESRPEHISATCFVFLAIDEHDNQHRKVSLKLMRRRDHFDREQAVRECQFNSDYVMDVLRTHPSLEEKNGWSDEVVDVEADATGQLTKTNAEKFYLLVMPLADRNLFVVLKQERWARENMEEVRHVFVQLVHCVEHMHEKGVLHADLKPFNFVRTSGQWKLIDLDAACVIGKESVGHKSSSAYVPPEAIYVDEQSASACVRSVVAMNKGEANYELLTAHPSFDVWSLGCILYQMCTADVKPLFQGGQEDNLISVRKGVDNLFSLAEWSPELKADKLADVPDKMARNLLSQMLHKDPLQRPSLARVLAHPFVSGKKVARLVGNKPKYDVYICCRYASDLQHAEKLFHFLTAQGLKVFLDKICLEPGVDWEQGFIEGLINSRTFVPLLSRDAFNHADVIRQNFSKLTADSRCDNVFLEHRLAVELQGLGLIEKIFPIFIGDLNATTLEYSNYFDSGCHPSLYEVTVKSVEEKLRHHMERQAFGTPLVPDRTVISVINAITACQGAFIEGPADTAFAAAVASIAKLRDATFRDMDASAKVYFLSQKVFTKAELAEHDYEYWFYMVFEAKPPFDAELDRMKADMSAFATEEDSTDEYLAAYTLLCDRIVDYVKDDNTLAYKPNNQGLLAVKNARGTILRERIRSVVLWHGRYMTYEDPIPTHQSATCSVFKATDMQTGDFVALKLMRRKDQYEREIEQRRRLNAVEGVVNTANECMVVEEATSVPERQLYTGDEPSSLPNASSTTNDQAQEQPNDHVMNLLHTYPEVGSSTMDGWPDEVVDVEADATGQLTKTNAEKFYLLVMPLADRNLFVALKQERWAGKNMEEVRHVFVQLVHCIEHMHEKGVLHADLKTLNIVRTSGQWKLIDLDAACVIGKEPVGHKSSSAYVPPEAIYVDEQSDSACVRSVVAMTKGEANYELLTAHPSFDVWSLGCILYQMCTADVKPLFQGGREDNLVDDLTDEDNLFALAEWSKELKEKKLARVVDKMARNMLSQMLHKDPLLRPSLSRVLAHPFVSGKKVVRLIGDKAKYDVFLSYRVKSDGVDTPLRHVEKLYNLLTAQGLNVFWDKICLEPGVDWEQGFCEGLVSSRAFVPLLSRDAINHPNKAWQNFSKLTADSRCDNVFLEHRLAVELQGLGLIEKMFPIFIGNLDATTLEYSRYNDSGCHPSLTEVTVKSVEEKLRHHMESQALGTPLVPDRTVISVINAITACQGAFIVGPADTAFAAAAASIAKMLTGASVTQSPRGDTNIHQALLDTMDAKRQKIVH